MNAQEIANKLLVPGANGQTYVDFGGIIKDYELQLLVKEVATRVSPDIVGAVRISLSEIRFVIDPEGSVEFLPPFV